MPKINGKPVDPKVYAKRVTGAKKVLAKTDPSVKTKIAEMYSSTSSKVLADKMLKSAKKKPLPSKSISSGKKTQDAVRRRQIPGTPVPMPKRNLPLIGGRKATPVPMPKRSATGATPKIAPGPKRKSPGTATPKPRVQKPKLDDFLLKGKRPPMKIKPGLKRPSVADVILKGYNDKKTINKYKKK